MEGQEVYASTWVVAGQLVIVAEQTGSNTQAGRAVELIQSAPTYDTRIGDYAEELGNKVVVPSMLVGATVLAVTGDPQRAIAPLQLDFGGGIGVSVPTAVLAALNYAARTGVYIRSGRALEVLARIDTVVFDKTGTLTQTRGTVVGIETTDAEIPSAELLALAASAEQYLTHPVAEAIVRYAQAQGVKTRKCDTWDYYVGMGVTAQISGQEIALGSSRFLQHQGVDIDANYIRSKEGTIRDRSLVYVARNGKLLGIICYSNSVRPESASVIKTLHQQSISTHILTGDDHRVASAVAYKLGISLGNTHAAALPEKKVKVLQKLHDDSRTVAYIGDGINDAAALCFADVSISFACGSDIARETADVVLMDNDLRSLTHAIDVAKQAMEIVHQNIAIVAIPNISVVLAGVIFGLNPVLGVIISNGATIIAELNGLRPFFSEDRQESTANVALARTDEGLLGVPWYKRPRTGLDLLPS